jgi:hypothetical protein
MHCYQVIALGARAQLYDMEIEIMQFHSNKMLKQLSIQHHGQVTLRFLSAH